jgi:hypothetical protein
LLAICIGVLVPDFLLTLAVVAVERKPRYLLYAPFYVFMRMLDAGITLYTLPCAWRETSNGRWSSPTRRNPVGAVGTAAPSPVEASPELQPDAYSKSA